MDLIWAVRRIAFRHAVEVPRIQRPPKHPIYPDHYRPGHPSDNTKRARNHARKPIKQGKSIAKSGAATHSDGDEDERSGARSTVKLSATKTNSCPGQIGRHQVELPNRPKSLTQTHRRAVPTSLAREGDRAAGTTTHQGPAKSPNLPPRGPSQAQAVSILNSFSRISVTSPQDATISQLHTVSNTFRDNIDAVVECISLMRTMYSKDKRLAEDTIYRELEQLKKSFDSCITDAESGTKSIDNVILVLSRK